MSDAAAPPRGGTWDAVVVGGGFYGACIAAYLVRRRGLERVCVVEREPRLLSRASFNNQARVHNGYHYPRSFTTAFRSRVNLPRFVADWPDAVKRDFTKTYAIARRNSKVTSRQFVRFCREIGASLRPADEAVASLFAPRLVESVFDVQEWAFDASVLAAWAREELARCGVEVRLSTRATAVRRASEHELVVHVESGEEGVRTPGGATAAEDILVTRLAFNCTYAGLNQIAGDFGGVRTGLKQEITEIALLDLPHPLRDIGVTVMDGPFYSMMPFPARQLHTLTHVRYTPHLQWVDRPGIDPYGRLSDYEGGTRAAWMLRDVARYMPGIADASYVESLFEVKTVLMKNEANDARPILFESNADLPGFFSVLGGKIDNIYDVLEELDAYAL
ncbi:NAD(P)/FAD-dependent oxidoreductase [Nocardioides xinjiangensis]|uniref:NAD(P)/FAD-dependent oxidoreductase n=1 Tax=Nocardioides xinjiangensis TaxID=2817376 RepID=UPI001B315533|nr:FAD-dependent oxidoreductase [Nocardioides sp. SYSU D00514]